MRCIVLFLIAAAVSPPEAGVGPLIGGADLCKTAAPSGPEQAAGAGKTLSSAAVEDGGAPAGRVFGSGLARLTGRPA